MKKYKPKCSVIIPTLNEAEYLKRAIASIQPENAETEIIVVDSSSTDSTIELAGACGAHIKKSKKGRGIQCNKGAQQASGEILIFLHADTMLPQNAFNLIQKKFSKPEVQIAKFRMTFDSQHFMLVLYAWFARFDTTVTSFGDQCIVMRKSFFEEIGGFPDWPLFEDVQLFRVSRKQTKIHTLPAKVITSMRRFQKYGLIRCQINNVWMMLQYFLEKPPDKLAWYYQSDYFQNVSIMRLLNEIMSGIFCLIRRWFKKLLGRKNVPQSLDISGAAANRHR